jgi:saccharopine dehydrogenase-like NADP-dependent oxidoreductase
MKTIVVLGAGRSSPFLINRLLDLAPDRGWRVVVADRDPGLARMRTEGRPHAEAVPLDAANELALAGRIAGADLVITMLAPEFQARVARYCVDAGAHLLSVSYLSRETLAFDQWAKDKGVLLLGEMGLDPGIDHMLAARAVRTTLNRGGRILGFRSFGSGIPAPESRSNPLRYLVTWNPWNVATSGRAGAQYLEDGRVRVVPHERLFLHTWPVDVAGVGTLEAYPNRDSLRYLEHFDLDEVRTMIRGTLRWPGFCETWAKVVKLGLANDSLEIPRLGERSPREVVAMFLPIPVPADRVEAAATLFLELNPTGRIMQSLRYLGLFDEEPTGCEGSTAAAMLAHLLQARLAPQAGDRDMVILVHEMVVEYPDRDLPRERLTWAMVDTGDPLSMSAMARTVGLPTALAAEMVLGGELKLTGCQLPTHPAICDTVLDRLKAEGLRFTETVEPQG